MDSIETTMPQAYQYEQRVTHIPIAHTSEIESELRKVVLDDETRAELVKIAPSLRNKWPNEDGQPVWLLTTGATTIVLYDIPWASDEGKVLASANLNRSLYVRDGWVWWKKVERLGDAHHC